MESMESHYPEEGEFAPDFSFKTASGKSMKLSDYRGERCILLYFYPKDFTPGCTIEAKEFSTDNEKFESRGITIPYELISDADHRISSLYGSYGPKNYMGKEYLGVSRSTFLIGKDGKLIKAFHRVKPLGHSEQVMKEFGNSC